MSYYESFVADIKFDAQILCLADDLKDEVLLQTGFSSCYSKTLTELIKTVKANNFENFQKIFSIIKKLNEIDRENNLKSIYNDDDCPLKQNNLIIVCCKYNSKDILEYVLKEEKHLLNYFTTDIARSAITPFDEDEDGKNAFYYTIRTSNVQMLDLLINDWPDKIDDQTLDDLLSKAYRKLILQNVWLTNEIKFYVESKLLNLRFYHEHFGKVPKSKTNLVDIKLRSEFVVKNIKSICEEDLNCERPNEKFLFVVRSLIGHFYTLKRELPDTYDRLPWEEIHFCLVVYLKNVNNSEENSFFYRWFLSRVKLVKYLKEFGIRLENIMNNYRGKTKGSEKNRETIKRNLSGESEIFAELYENYEKLRDMYSLSRIKFNLDLLISSNFYNKEHELLLVERCFQVIGENIKNTSTTPNLSNEIQEALLDTFPENTISTITNLRNILSKDVSLKSRVDIKTGNRYYYESFANFRKDLRKIQNFIALWFYRKKFEVFQDMLSIIRSSSGTTCLSRICESFNWGHIKLDDATRKDTNNAKVVFAQNDKLKRLINELNEEIKLKNSFQKDLFDKIYKILDDCDEKNVFTLEKYKSDFIKIAVIVRELSFGVTETLNEEKSFYSVFSFDKKNYINSQNNCNTKEIVNLCKKLAEHDPHNENVTNIIKRIVLFHRTFDKNIKSIVQYEKYFPQNTNSKVKQMLENKKTKSVIFEDKMKLLNSILGENLIKDREAIQRFVKSRQSGHKMALLEMLLLDILTYNEKNLNDNTDFLDQAYPLLGAKELRHYLAHGNYVIDIMPFNVKFLIVETCINYINYYKNNPSSVENNFRSKNIKISELLETFSQDCTLIESKMDIFDQIKSNNFKIEGLDTKIIDFFARDIENYSLPEIAVQTNNVSTVKYLLDEFFVMTLKNPQNFDKRNFFHLCAMESSVEIFHFICEKFKNSVPYLKERDAHARTPLHYAVIKSSPEMVDAILKVDTNSVNMQDFFINRPINLATNLEIFKILLKYENDLDKDGVAGGYTLLYKFAKIGLLEFVKLLLDMKANINFANKDQLTALHTATFSGHIDVVRHLLENGADVNPKDMENRTPLHFSIRGPNEHVASLLLEYKADINQRQQGDGMTPLHLAVMYQKNNLVQSFLEYGANVDCSSNYGNTPLHIAALLNYKNTVKILLNFKADVNVVNSELCTPLHYAVKSEEIFNMLLESGGKIDVFDRNKTTPLDRAVSENNFDVISIIENNKVKVDLIKCLPIATKNNNLRLFKYLFEKLNPNGKQKLDFFERAAYFGSAEICNYLLDTNIINIESVCEDFLAKLLHTASWNNQPEIVNILIQNGADPNVKILNRDPLEAHLLYSPVPNLKIVQILLNGGYDLKSENLLEYAIETNNKEIVEFLLNHGANVNGVSAASRPIVFAFMYKNQDILKLFLNHPQLDPKLPLEEEKTLLHYAAKFADSEVVRLVIEKGLNVKAKDCFNVTPLQTAVLRGELDIVKELIKQGADLNSRIDYDRIQNTTPLHIATMNGFSGIMDLLIKNGAEVDILDKMGTPLHYAVEKNNMEAVGILLNCKDVGLNLYNNQGVTPLGMAAVRNYVEIAKKLIEQDTEKRIKNDDILKSMHLAAQNGSSEVLKYLFEHQTIQNIDDLLFSTMLSEDNYEILSYLLQKGANINGKSVLGNTILHIAVQRSSQKMCKFLLKKGAILNTKNNSGLTPFDVANDVNRKFLENIISITSAVESDSTERVIELLKQTNYEIPTDVTVSDGLAAFFYAILNQNEIIVEHLLKMQPNVNICDSFQNTLLHKASVLGNLTLVNILLNNGAFYNTFNSNGKTPLDLARTQEIKIFLQLIDDLFTLIKENSRKIFKKCEMVINFDEIKLTLATVKDSNGMTLLQYAELQDVDQLDELEEVFLEKYEVKLIRGRQLVEYEEYPRALEIFSEILRDYQTIFGFHHPKVFEVEYNIVHILSLQRKFQEAFDKSEELLKKEMILFGEYHSQVLKLQSFRANLLNHLDRLTESIEMLQNIVDKQTEYFGAAHSNTLDTKLVLISVLNKAGRRDEGIFIENEILEDAKSLEIGTDAQTLILSQKIAILYRVHERHDEAFHRMAENYKKSVELLGLDHGFTLKLRCEKISLLVHLKQFDEAEREYTILYGKFVEKYGENNREAIETKYEIGQLKFAQGNIIEAVKIFGEIFEKYKRILGSTHAKIKRIERILNWNVNRLPFDRLQEPTNKFQTKKLPIECLKMEFFEVLKEQNLSKIMQYINVDKDLVNVKFENDFTPLHFAIGYGNKFIVNCLLENGSNVFEKTAKGNTVFHLVSARNQIEICQILIQFLLDKNSAELPAIINSKTIKGGKTALHVAAENGCVEICKLLLQNGASAEIVDSNGKTPRCIAGNREIFQLFEKNLRSVDNMGNIFLILF